MLRPLDQTLLAGFIALKIWLLFALPLTGDEAYWILWGQNLALGYYDHPPMVGWVLAIMQLHSDELWWIRIVGLVTSVAISWAIYAVLCVAEPSLVFRRRHLLVALAFFVSPASLLFVMTANDTVLALFGFLGFAAFAVAVIRRSVVWAFLAGLLLGCAVLSKYFAVFPILGLLVFSVWQLRRIGWGIPVAASLGLVGLSAINFFYNYTHCWNNVLFNFFSRTRGGEWGYENPIAYLGILLLFIGPWSIWHWIRCGGRYTGVLKTELGLMVRYASLPLLLVLAVVSLRHSVGLHWPILVVPIIWLLLRALPEAALSSVFRWNALCSLALGGLAYVFLSNPAPFLGKADREALALHLQTQKVCERLPDEALFTMGYSSQSILAVSCQRSDIHVFASRSKFGREDDLHTDFRQLDGQDLRILVLGESEIPRLSDYFDSIEINALGLEGANYSVVTGRHFSYERYRSELLSFVIRNYYEAPYWFPQPGACPVRERYGL